MYFPFFFIYRERVKQLSKQEGRQKFLLLLQQLELTDNVYMSFFENGALERVTVHKKKRIWHFKINIENILPYQVYQLLRMRMVEKFAHIANVSLTIQSNNPVVTEQHLLEYWQAAIEQMGEMSPLLRENLMKQQNKPLMKTLKPLRYPFNHVIKN